ncbi:MAG: flagellar assembly protein FliW, partial [Deltaproteobacteria bacterium]|nr:flagellar assembly protein FliW [Deltaproteobacteria bacterium]
FGTITIEEEKIITMPFGMLGFPDVKRYVILQHKENSPFFWYQSVDDPTLAFVIMSPFLFKPDYNVDVENVLKEMSWNEEEKQNNLELYVVVNIPKGEPDKMTANFIGPILINNKIHQAVQMVISDSPYTHKFPLVREN